MGIDAGKIVIITMEPSLPKANRVLDAKGKLLLPGVIDAHTHLREPGRTSAEDFETGTKAAAAGGVTTVFEMPLSVPCVSSAEILEKRRDLVQPRAVVDFGLYGGAGMHNVDKIRELAAAAPSVSRLTCIILRRGGKSSMRAPMSPMMGICLKPLKLWRQLG